MLQTPTKDDHCRSMNSYTASQSLNQDCTGHASVRVADDDDCRIPIRLNRRGEVGTNALCSILGICATTHMSTASILSASGWIRLYIR